MRAPYPLAMDGVRMFSAPWRRLGLLVVGLALLVAAAPTPADAAPSSGFHLQRGMNLIGIDRTVSQMIRS